MRLKLTIYLLWLFVLLCFFIHGSSAPNINNNGDGKEKNKSQQSSEIQHNDTDIPRRFRPNNPQENVDLITFAGTLSSFVYEHNRVYRGIGVSDTVEAEPYHARYYTLRLRQKLKLHNNFYLFLQYQQDYHEILETKVGGILETGQVLGSVGRDLISRIGFSLDFDSRDNNFSPFKGSFYTLSFLASPRMLGNNYQIFDVRLDARHYFSIFPKHVLAVQSVVQSISGEAPFHLLPVIGTHRVLRGFETGQYRDRKMILLQSEYRFPIWKRFGGVVFAAAGEVGEQFQKFTWDQVKVAYGVGLRYELFKGQRFNLRFDYGLSSEGNRRFYFHITEAF